jgi:hypothetical protein
MAKDRDPRTLQVLKAPKGDMMLVVPIDKATATKLQKRNLSVEIVTERPKIKLPLCLVRYDKFRFMKDFVIRPLKRR